MKRIINFFLLLGGVEGCLFGETYQFPDIEIKPEYEQIISNPYTDHITVFDYFFSKTKVSSFLEFGLGVGTKFFLEHCDDVTSIEILTPTQSSDWYEKCLSEYEEYTNWSPLLYEGSQSMQRADIQARSGEDPALFDGQYLFEIKNLCEKLLSEKTYEVAFVDAGVHFRGDIVKELFGKIQVIIAHDTNYGQNVYGWRRISTPFDYVRIDWKSGCGTTFWIHKSREDLIKSLVPDYSPLPKKNLRIFFPDMHIDVTKSMALLCKHLGHTLLIPGPSFDPTGSSKGLKIQYGRISGHISKTPELRPWYFQENVEIIENEEIFTNPPDVLFVSCDFRMEEDVLAIYKVLNARYPDIKLAYYSGNDNCSYNKKYVKNLISTDATTPSQYDLNQIHYAYWIPWIDWEAISFLEVNDTPCFRSYLGDHYLSSGFHSSRDLYKYFVSSYEDDTKAHFELINWVSQEEMFKLMDESMGTIHVKSLEGTGYTIIQSLARGRPVFLKRSFSQGKRLMNWCIEDQTAVFFDTEQEFKEKIDRYLSDRQYRHFLQKNCAKQIRRFIDNERQAQIFEGFLHNLN